MKKIVIIPAYNEEGNIKSTVENIVRFAAGFDYIVINDCSTDQTKKICEENHYNLINLPVNLGIGGAVQTGYKYAVRHNYDIAVQVDGDGQHDPTYLNKMARVLETENLDMVIGSRFIERQGFQSSFVRRIGIVYFSSLIKLLTGHMITDPTSGLRLSGKAVLQQFADEYPKDYPEPESIVAVLKSGKRVKEVPVIMQERQSGISSISVLKSFYYMIKVTLAIIVEKIRK